MEYVLDYYKYFKAAMPAMNAASFLGISGLVEALSVMAKFAATGFGVGSVFLGIGAILGGYGIYRGSTDIGNSSLTLSQSIANDISNITSFAMETAWPQISKTLQKVDAVMDSSMVFIYITSIIISICAAVWLYWQYERILHENRLRWWEYLIPVRFRRERDTIAANLMKYAMCLIFFLILILLVLLFILIPKIFVTAGLIGCIILIGNYFQLHVVTCTFLKQMAHMIYAQNVPNNSFSIILVYALTHLFTLYLVLIVVHIYQLRSSALLCLPYVCISRVLTSVLTSLYHQVV
jgi:hypothetical protein